MKRQEENPFKDAVIAAEWINSVENEKDRTRDRAIYPYLKQWASGFPESATILEIGSGQGICSEKLESPAKYLGVEPSELLVKRAIEKYAAPNRTFVVGDAYDLPVEDASVDAAFSVNVWFHLEDLEAASQEMRRVLKTGAEYLIITADPDSHGVWESFFESPEKNGKRLVGKVRIPVNPLSKNIFYQHSLSETRQTLEAAGLTVSVAEKIKVPPEMEKEHEELFIAIQGSKAA